MESLRLTVIADRAVKKYDRLNKENCDRADDSNHTDKCGHLHMMVRFMDMQKLKVRNA